jgi:hypothetical protein
MTAHELLDLTVARPSPQISGMPQWGLLRECHPIRAPCISNLLQMHLVSNG